MTAVHEIASTLDATLEVARFRDYCVNGLQVEGTRDVKHVVTGVSASGALLDQAISCGADLIIVHHGLFWHGVGTLTGPLARRVERLMRAGVSLAAYHLPLDKHATLGNNAGLCDALGLTVGGHFGDVRGTPLGVVGELAKAVSIAEFTALVARAIPNQIRPFVFSAGARTIRRVGVCSGAASDLLEAAAAAGCDAFVTGELAERAGELARELGLHLIAAGHYATEVFGPQRVAAHVATHWAGQLTAEFIDCPTPL